MSGVSGKVSGTDLMGYVSLSYNVFVRPTLEEIKQDKALMKKKKRQHKCEKEEEEMERSSF